MEISMPRTSILAAQLALIASLSLDSAHVAGSSDFRTVQAALDALPNDDTSTRMTVGGRVWHLDTEGPRLANPQPARDIAWKDCLNQPAAWYGSVEAIRIADNLLVYQRRNGGWPKNIDMAKALGPAERAGVVDEKDQADSTIDNQATYTQIRFLARVFAATHVDRFKAAALSGLDYLLAAQYPNGGWSQFFPLRPNYSRHITFNDDAMIGVMDVLREVSAGRAPFDWVDNTRRRLADGAVARGVKVILACQVRVNGKLTAWCAQHDEKTLRPAGARSYEHPSLSGRESVGIVEFLMGVERPDAPVVAAIEGAVAWLRSVQLSGIRVVRRASPVAGERADAVAEQDASAPPLWARFYEIGSNRPIFSGRDGVVKYRLDEIEYERRANYSWYGTWPAELLDKRYPDWLRKGGRTGNGISTGAVRH
jgi:PelA/Pel-15E family pectate lyase